MGKILAGYLFPHPPIIVEEIGGKEGLRAKKTIEGCRELARDIGHKSPDTIILVTPHGPLFSDAIAISVEERLEGSFYNFGNRMLNFEYENNIELVDAIVDESTGYGIRIAKVDSRFAMRSNIDLELDHGALVPLYFIGKEYSDFKLVHITYGLLSPKELHRFGKLIQEMALKSGERTVFVASGDLSHKLSTSGPYTYSPYGKEFDTKLVELLGDGDLESIVSFDLELSEKAGQCALRSLMIMAGYLDGLDIAPEVLSYEGPFGVGYANARFSVMENKYVALARKSLEHYIRYGKSIELSGDMGQELLDSRGGVFVTIKKKGRLRGCVGTIEPICETLAEEIARNAVSAGVRDPRFDRVTEDELEDLVYSVDILNSPEPIGSIDELDIDRYGVIVSKGFRRGLLLPRLDGVDSEEEQVSIALKKAGIGKDEAYLLERFEVIRYY
ncbi:MAG: AmmeMemoRadiSam system protein A [Tissierellia bacterium]|nr:AmmeMemoRadiSam system protein A [Tissierellia bacterium]